MNPYEIKTRYDELTKRLDQAVSNTEGFSDEDLAAAVRLVQGNEDSPGFLERIVELFGRNIFASQVEPHVGEPAVAAVTAVRSLISAEEALHSYENEVKEYAGPVVLSYLTGESSDEFNPFEGILDQNGGDIPSGSRGNRDFVGRGNSLGGGPNEEQYRKSADSITASLQSAGLSVPQKKQNESWEEYGERVLGHYLSEQARLANQIQGLVLPDASRLTPEQYAIKKAEYDRQSINLQAALSQLDAVAQTALSFAQQFGDPTLSQRIVENSQAVQLAYDRLEQDDRQFKQSQALEKIQTENAYELGLMEAEYKAGNLAEAIRSAKASEALQLRAQNLSFLQSIANNHTLLASFVGTEEGKRMLETIGLDSLTAGSTPEELELFFPNSTPGTGPELFDELIRSALSPEDALNQAEREALGAHFDPERTSDAQAAETVATLREQIENRTQLIMEESEELGEGLTPEEARSIAESEVAREHRDTLLRDPSVQTRAAQLRNPQFRRTLRIGTARDPGRLRPPSGQHFREIQETGFTNPFFFETALSGVSPEVALATIEKHRPGQARKKPGRVFGRSR